ncbi:XAC2610-related protein [Elizabethkingia occulta]|uniref:XAC2610-related protein n=1 Tax=Elizabethkingia occulta TaxID=1867263 RepID=UPI00398C43CF
MGKLVSILLFISGFSFGQKTEYFSDSKTLIKPGKYKINITQKNNKNKSVVSFDLYRKSGNKWSKIQNGSFEKQADFSLSVTTDEDLNNDGYNDLKISYAQAARGANEIEKLLIFSPKTQKLTEIINSQQYPNLHYNAKRNCITSYMFYGGNATYFLHLKQNKLEGFGKVEFSNDSIYSYKIRNKQEFLLKKQAYKSNDGAVFFSNFDPVEE